MIPGIGLKISKLAQGGWNLAKVVNMNKLYYSTDIYPEAVFFKPDGTKMYIAGQQLKRVDQYTLTTPWNITTAVSDNKYKSLNYGNGSPSALYFKPDGSAYFVNESASDWPYTARISMYTMSTPWDVSTAYFNNSFNLGCTGITFDSTGTKMIVLDGSGATAYQYTLTTPWNITTAVSDNKSASLFTDSGKGIFISTDGKKFFALRYDSAIYQYTLTTAWDISTIVFDNISLYPFDKITDMYFDSTGKRLYISRRTDYSINQFSL